MDEQKTGAQNARKTSIFDFLGSVRVIFCVAIVIWCGVIFMEISDRARDEQIPAIAVGVFESTQFAPGGFLSHDISTIVTDRGYFAVRGTFSGLKGQALEIRTAKGGGQKLCKAKANWQNCNWLTRLHVQDDTELVE